MSRHRGRQPGVTGAALHVVIALVATAVGALGTWLVREAGTPASAAVTTHGEWVWIKKRNASDSIRAYVAYPERKDKAPAVLVIHEIFGVTAWEPTVADRLAQAGYVAILPDLLSSRFGITPTDPDSGRKLIAQLTPAGIMADLDATADYANGLPAVRQGDLATIGFCWGGNKSFLYAAHNPKLRAAVVCYGPTPDSAALANVGAAVLGVYGENDARINQDLGRAEMQMKALGKRFEHDIYPGTGHGFLKPGRQGSDGPQVDRAWSRILAFYQANLGK